jgi:hypothetical protein
MSWGLSILVGFLTGALGAVCGGLVSALACEWQQVGSREGERAYMAVYGALLGIAIGIVVGIVSSRMLATEPNPSFMKALGWSSGVLLGLSLLLLAISFASAPPAPAGAEAAVVDEPKAEPKPPSEPEEDYATKRMRELKGFTPDTPLGVWLGYSRGNDATEVKDFARRAIAARPQLHADLCGLLDTQRCTEALLYIQEEIQGAPEDLGEGIRAALRQVPDLLRRTFDDPSGVRSDSGLYDVRIALQAADKFTTATRSYAPEVAEIAHTFEAAPRVRRISRGSRYVEEKIKEFEAERLLAAWRKKKG